MLEPFAGLGTTIIESLIYGAFVYWLDYNPLSHLICRVRTSEISSQTARQEAEKYTWRHPVGHLSQFKRAWDYASSLDTP
jgi:hypothetical protein